jgi:hypothetical protein
LRFDFRDYSLDIGRRELRRDPISSHLDLLPSLPRLLMMLWTALPTGA